MTRKHKASCDTHPKWVRGCRDCLRIKSRYNKQRNLSQLRGEPTSAAVDITRQRLRELFALGYGMDEIARRANIDRASVWRIANDPATRWVQLGLFHGVERVWTELHLYPATGQWADRTRRIATGKGWTPPAALPAPEQIDEDIVDGEAVRRALSGDQTVPLTRAERHEAFRLLEERGLSARQIGERLGVATRTVDRWRAGVNKPVARRTA